MGAGDDYRVIVRRLVEEEALGQPSHGNTEVIAVCDDVSGNYLALVVGWSGSYRHDHAFIHLRLKDGKVWIEHNGTEEDLVGQLVAAGIHREDIVLGFISPDERWRQNIADAPRAQATLVHNPEVAVVKCGATAMEVAFDCKDDGADAGCSGQMRCDGDGGIWRSSAASSSS